MTHQCRVESGLQLLARLNTRPNLESIYPQLFSNGPKNKDVIEISYEINTYQTSILYDVISTTLLPEKTIGGRCTGIVLILTDGQFDFVQLLAVMNHKVKEKIKVLFEEDELENKVEEIVSNSLTNFHILRVYDSCDLSMAILNLENILSKNLNISLVVLDTIVAFYWSERLMNTNNMTKMDDYLSDILKMLQKATKQYNVVILYTKPSYFSSVSENLDGLSEIVEIQATKLENAVYKVSLSRKMVENDDLDNQSNVMQAKIISHEDTVIKYFVLCDLDIKWI